MSIAWAQPPRIAAFTGTACRASRLGLEDILTGEGFACDPRVPDYIKRLIASA